MMAVTFKLSSQYFRSQYLDSLNLWDGQLGISYRPLSLELMGWSVGYLLQTTLP